MRRHVFASCAVILFLIQTVLADVREGQKPGVDSQHTVDDLKVQVRSVFWEQGLEIGLANSSVPDAAKEYRRVDTNMAEARNVDEYFRFYTKASADLFKGQDARKEMHYQNALDFAKRQKIKLISRRLFAVVTFSEHDVEYAILVLDTAELRGLDGFPQGFYIDTYTFEDGAWKVDISANKVCSALRMKLGRGLWTKFGGKENAIMSKRVVK